ncbi:aldehyde dehydrogenase (NADP(+)), partial [Azospirillum brasilense]|nr:aldehyde dehydrogenase (NADP(+)) [Azospirillum brasilense]
ASAVWVAHPRGPGRLSPANSARTPRSVGTAAIERFLRPVCYQDIPADLLPQALRDGNPLGLWRRFDGALGRH